MTNPIIEIHNALTGEEISRPMTDKEFAENQELNAENDAKKAEIEADIAAKAQAKSALAERLGLTAEEAALLLG